MASFGFGKKKKKKLADNMELNLTPMIDTFVVLLIFLIKVYSSTPEYLTPTQDIELASTTSEQAAPDKPALIVGKDGLLLNGATVVGFNEGIPADGFEKLSVIPELRDVLIRLKEKDGNFSGTLILQADKGISFKIIKPILRTAGAVGYNDIKFAGVFLE